MPLAYELCRSYKKVKFHYLWCDFAVRHFEEHYLVLNCCKLSLTHEVFIVPHRKQTFNKFFCFEFFVSFSQWKIKFSITSKNCLLLFEIKFVLRLFCFQHLMNSTRGIKFIIKFSFCLVGNFVRKPLHDKDSKAWAVGNSIN